MAKNLRLILLMDICCSFLPLKDILFVALMMMLSFQTHKCQIFIVFTFKYIHDV